MARHSPHSAGVVDKMSRDDKIGIAEQLRTAPILSPQAVWQFKAHPRRSPQDIEHARLCEMVFEQVKGDLLKALLKGHRYGVGLAEGFEEYQELNPDTFPNHPTGQALVFSRFREVLPRFVYSFEANKVDTTQARAIYLYSEGNTQGERIDLEKSRIIRWTLNGGSNNFFGFGTYRLAYGPWFLRGFLRTIAASKHDKFGLGTLIAKQPQQLNPEDVTKMAEMMYEYRADERGYFSLPYGWDLAILGTLQNGGQIGTDVESFIESCHRDVFGAFGASFQTMGDAKFGSFALADVHQNQFDNIISQDAGDIATVLAKGVDGWSFAERLRQANYPDALPCTIHPRNFPTKDYTARAKALTEAVRYGAVRGGFHIEKAILEGFRIREDEIDVDGWATPANEVVTATEPDADAEGLE